MTSLVPRTVWMMTVVLIALTGPVMAQQSVSDVLSFLVTNRSIATHDFMRDEQAAAATRDAISTFLMSELATLPISSSAGGFTYRLSPTLGTVVRSSESFGPFLTERSLTVGRRQASVGLNYQRSAFDTIDGRSLRDGTMVSIASRLQGDSQPFDVETMTLHIRTNTLTFVASYGMTDRLDVSAAFPFVRLTLSGQRVDTYRGQTSVQATGAGAASGLGDVLVRVKYGLVRKGGSGIAVGAEARLPTGDPRNLLGSADAAVKPRVIASYETQRLGMHGDLGYSFGGPSRELSFATALTAAALPTLTLIGELAGRRFDAFHRLFEITEPHPRLSGVETLRLTGVPQGLTHIAAIAGVKWNVASTWLVSASVTRPLTSAGLNAAWVPMVTLDYSMGL